MIFTFSDASTMPLGAVVADIPAEIRGKLELLDEIADQLAFPAYAGRNWDALSDALRDLSWIDRNQVVILHHDLPHLPAGDLAAYLDVLEACVESWRPGEAHMLAVVFPTSCEDRIGSLRGIGATGSGARAA